MAVAPRMTAPMQVVLRSLLDAHQDRPAREVYGLQLCDQLNMGFRTIYRILGRLHDAGWVSRRAETMDTASPNRATRIYYRLTDKGSDSAPRALAEASIIDRTRPRKPE